MAGWPALVQRCNLLLLLLPGPCIQPKMLVTQNGLCSSGLPGAIQCLKQYSRRSGLRRWQDLNLQLHLRLPLHLSVRYSRSLPAAAVRQAVAVELAAVTARKMQGSKKERQRMARKASAVHSHSAVVVAASRVGAEPAPTKHWERLSPGMHAWSTYVMFVSTDAVSTAATNRRRCFGAQIITVKVRWLLHYPSLRDWFSGCFCTAALVAVYRLRASVHM